MFFFVVVCVMWLIWLFGLMIVGRCWGVWKVCFMRLCVFGGIGCCMR